MAINRSHAFIDAVYLSKYISEFELQRNREYLRAYQIEALNQLRQPNMSNPNIHGLIYAKTREDYERIISITKIFGLQTPNRPYNFPIFVSLRVKDNVKGVGWNSTRYPYDNVEMSETIGHFTNKCDLFAKYVPPKPIPTPPSLSRDYDTVWEVDEDNELVTLHVGCTRIAPSDIRKIYSQLNEIERRWETELPF